MRSFLNLCLTAFHALWRWVKFSPNAGYYAILAALGAVLAGWFSGYHEGFTPPTPSSSVDIPKGWEPPPAGAYVTLYLLSYLRLFILTGGVAYHVFIFRAYPDVGKMVKPTWIAVGVLLVWLLAGQFYERWEAVHISSTGEVFSNAAFFLKLLLLCALPVACPFVLRYYSRALLMEKYVLRSFLQPLVFCFVAFFTLWIVMDLLDNMADFQENKISGAQILSYYVGMMPFIFVTIAPISLLLATVYVLGRMSRSNELISMLGAGRSLGQVLRPIFLVGGLCGFLGMVANYELGPTSAGNKQKLLENVTERIKQDVLALGVMYRNQENARTWFIGSVPSDLRHGKMRRIEIRQEDEKGRLVKAWFAKSAFWWPEARIWSLYGGMSVEYKNGQVISLVNFDFDGTGYNRHDLEGFSETPWILMSGSLTPDFLGVPNLISFIRANEAYESRKLAPFWTHLFYRFALPWQCLVVVLFAAPLSVAFSRRGLVGGIAKAVGLFFVLMFLDNLCLNLGKSHRLPAFIAVWVPHLLLGSLGWFLFQLRSQNREMPRLSLQLLWGGLVSTWETLRRRFFYKPAGA